MYGVVLGGLNVFVADLSEVYIAYNNPCHIMLCFLQLSSYHKEHFQGKIAMPIKHEISCNWIKWNEWKLYYFLCFNCCVKKISSDTCPPEAIGVIISFNWKFSIIVVINQGKYSVLELTDMTSRVPMLATSFEVLEYVTFFISMILMPRKKSRLSGDLKFWKQISICCWCGAQSKGDGKPHSLLSLSLSLSLSLCLLSLSNILINNAGNWIIYHR